ncbi:phosphonopyruvate decarboxylase [Paenibacillus hexagrammi]|uniref:Phosphonopyruvate decarboxylase n=1 Tax=Paenibacillus hexagrammi TaxID=2908839 RepID=A0ABY3SJA3_9BACL|nr:phosphonopyruvate decarboxylase [Paenibacillus sp. YPD9-1]UJF33220.1 phosphonopyruvate decarboxylase [Paenibacillus sp. YPD9-1]
MISTKVFGEELKTLGYDFFTGVPCSFLNDLINYAINDCEYISAANEGDAVAIASGAYLGGRKAVTLMQNSGLANAVSPLVSLNYVFKLPILGFVSLRGEAGLKDEPQHELMGQITTDLLELMQIKWAYLSDDITEASRQLAEADGWVEKKVPFFFVVKKGVFGKEPLHSQEFRTHRNETHLRRNKLKQEMLPSRFEALTVINANKDATTVQLATTGYTGRELYEVEDSEHNLYMVGSMGCVSSIGLGLAMSRPDKDIIAIDGDGALIMRLGNLATNAYYSPSNLLHILLDNNCHDSTGGQATVAKNLSFVDIAVASGYSHVEYLHNIEELEQAIKNWRADKKLTFLYLRTSSGAKENLSRPHVKPYEVKDRLVSFLNA